MTVNNSELCVRCVVVELPDCVYNWLIDFFQAHTHCSRFGGVKSSGYPMQRRIVGGVQKKSNMLETGLAQITFACAEKLW